MLVIALCNNVCSSRFFHWKLELYVMLFMIILVLPFYIAYFIVSNISFCKFTSILYL